jgi:hypothetical protein
MMSQRELDALCGIEYVQHLNERGSADTQLLIHLCRNGKHGSQVCVQRSRLRG